MPLAFEAIGRGGRWREARSKCKLTLTSGWLRQKKARMARRPQTSPRKSASQRRSQSTVDALIEATARLLIADGYDRTSTNKIAAVAGVSIGSLYQYFPNKEALVAAVVERHTQQLSQVALGAFLRVSEGSIEIGIRELVMAGINGHRVDPALHRILAEEAPRIGPRGDIDALQRNGRALIRSYLEAHRSEIDVADLDLAAFILVTTVEALTHSAVLHRPEVLADGKAGAFADEVTGLVLRYLRTSATHAVGVATGHPP
jgi:AcrR family transcriptional regulator